MEPNDPKAIPATSGSTESFTPSPATEAPVKKRKQFGWPFWILLASIFGLLAAIAVPNFVKARTTACKVACIANLKQIDGAVQQWALDNKKSGTNTVTTADILDYLKGSTLPACPSNGVYSVSTVSSAPTCSQSARGHSL